VEAVTDAGEITTVYNVRVEEYHTYFVGGEDWSFSVWSHNASCDSRLLGRALTADDQPNLTIDGQAAHVVPTGTFSNRPALVQTALNDARAALASDGIGINSAPNGFWATAGHNGTHTNEFFLQLGARMNQAVVNGNVSQTLNAIRSEAIIGAFN
jgi:hypothetical protein